MHYDSGMSAATDTIAAIATGHAVAGVGVLRISGPKARAIAETISHGALKPRHAHYGKFRDADGEVIDDGIALFFPGPHSYTGEDVVELQAHGSPVLLALLLRRCLELGARAARAGEFTERAFLNEKLDLAQAEAVADLISAGSAAAARAARRSLDGEFSRRVEQVVEGLTQLRVYIEAALDFPDEDIDFLAAPELATRLAQVSDALAALRRDAERGKRLVDGLHVVIVGAPNVGKSSLLNRLTGEDRAIVSTIAGTTRDLLRESIQLDGIELTLVDTAGLRHSPDVVEAEGIRRARAELARADLALAVLDDREPQASAEIIDELRGIPAVFWLHNKSDLSGAATHEQLGDDGRHLWLSARTGDGIALLRTRLREAAGLGEGSGGSFSARARHLQALARSDVHLAAAKDRLAEGSGELAAEELRQAQDELSEITGKLDADHLLGRIFADFCIGK
jgi:tRNA modification GTPase